MQIPSVPFPLPMSLVYTPETRQFVQYYVTSYGRKIFCEHSLRHILWLDE
jgi:hypothetical protein